MALTNLVWMLTGLAAVVILITRTRLHATQRQSGVSDVPDAVLNVHTFAGVWALAFWVWTLLGAPSWAGRIGLVLWWLVTLVGLLVLARWLPGKGSHSQAATDDTIAQGPGLSILGHVGMLLGVAFFTWVLVADKV